jgi:hypothetical protein
VRLNTPRRGTANPSKPAQQPRRRERAGRGVEGSDTARGSTRGVVLLDGSRAGRSTRGAACVSSPCDYSTLRAQCPRRAAGSRPATRGRWAGLSSGWPRAQTVRGSSVSARRLCLRRPLRNRTAVAVRCPCNVLTLHVIWTGSRGFKGAGRGTGVSPSMMGAKPPNGMPGSHVSPQVRNTRLL